MNRPVVAFAGMTHLGLCSAAAAAARGFDVIGFHDDPKLVEDLKAGRFHISEPDLSETIMANRTRITFTNDATDLSRCDVVYLSIDVPTDDSGKGDLRTIERMFRLIEDNASEDALLVILCQVPPGFTRGIGCSPTRLYYQVETLVFGQAITRALKPERIIVGCGNPHEPIDPRLEAFLSAFECPILPMRYESAELAKISINMCLVASVSVANMMAEICEQIEADWSEIVPALKLDRRIGQFSYLKPGLGLAGGNLERDLATVATLAKRHDTDGSLIEAWLVNSQRRRDWVWETLKREVLNENCNPDVGILGLAYKENTHSTKNSPALSLLKNLEKCNVKAHDPIVTAEEADISCDVTNDPLEACENTDAVAVMTPWPAYREIDPHDLAQRMRGRTVIDPYGIWQSGKLIDAGLDHFTLGKPPSKIDATARKQHA